MAHVSIIINNYNYEAYLGAAIDSALSQSYEDCEVIVVDDGSQDGSVALIEAYGDRVLPVLKENGGQASAFNAGFSASKGDWVLFLDADDVIDPDAVSTIIFEVCGMAQPPAVVEFYLRYIDADGAHVLGDSTNPLYLTEHGQLRELLRRGTYWFAPTSGNLFSRGYLEQIFPMPEEEFRICADLYLQILSPFHGAITVMPKPPLGSYRIHGNNNYFSGANSEEQFDKELLRSLQIEKQKHQLVRKAAAEKGLSVSRFLECRISIILFRRVYACMKYGVQSPYPSDRRVRLVGKQAMGFFGVRSPKALYRSLQLFSGSLLLLVLPRAQITALAMKLSRR
jgi:glycosyltransferase involved in cell wall biosynthesis